MNPLNQRIPKQVTNAPTGAAVSSRFFQALSPTTITLMKNEARSSVQLARSYRLAGEHECAVQFLNDAIRIQHELSHHG
ncbi:hypothetical protein MHO82_24620 [Vibrio sp. Of7-15]|uniref:hypothetical protein n=1 Tax=Vibrio sp. Of7-15 TaxID=2724879 RepID=UPI001EF2BFE3|nr:hypothetical protein [Vibrio sp. Of7-15]MCG7500052.1 hypothetical protein [Vibrio sp. Of7-15]